MVKKSSPDSEESEKNNLLTETQQQVLNFIRDTCEKTGVPPAFRDIQTHFGYKAVGTVQDHVHALIRKGVLEGGITSKKGEKRRARGLIPTGFRPEGIRQIPIYGEIAAGLTRDSPQIELGSLTITSDLSKASCFALRVVGDSMQEVGILEGDLLIVERTKRVHSGEIVVALLNRETTVKRYVEKAGKVFLVPENQKMQPIEVLTEDFEVQGKVIGLQRRF